MKKIAVSIIFFCFTNALFAQYTFTGKLSGLSDDDVIELIPGATHKDEKAEAVATVKNQTFVFKGNLKEPRLYYLRIKGATGSYSLFLENGQIQLTGDVEFSDRNGQKSVNFKNISVAGSELNTIYAEKFAYKQLLNKEYSEIRKKHEVISRQISEARGAKDQAKVDSLSNTEAGLKLDSDEKSFFQRVESYSKKAIFDDKNSWWGPFLMLDIMGWYTEQNQPWFDEFSPEAQQSYYGQILKRELFPKKFTGETPSFTVNNGETDLSFADLAKGKKIIVIDFWASWCGPCRKEIPELKKIYENFSSKGFEIVSISIDDNKSAWQKALSQEKMNWPNFLDETKAIREQFNIRSIPATFMVNETGKIIMENFRSNELSQKLGELLNN
ncbi:thiol:disulfide interchange protein [Bacteroidia bacterium]|nr:thiol:disulfide interchange protein [Bacteroidia bacterium]